MFTALDLVSIQTSTRVQGAKVRRNKSLTEINHYDAEHDEINVRDVYQWQAESDAFLEVGGSNTLEEIRFDRGWSNEELDEQLFLRKVVLAYLIENGLNEYRQVAATLQAFINDPETITALIANDELAASLEALREMESVLIDVEPEKEALVPRPEPDEETSETARGILERTESEVFEEHRGPVDAGVGDALVSEPAEDVTATPAGPDEDEPWFDEGDVDRAASDGGMQVEDASRASEDERSGALGSEHGWNEREGRTRAGEDPSEEDRDSDEEDE
jgi:archaeal flagellar protein FlaI